MSTNDIPWLFLWAIVLIPLYLLPTFLSHGRRHRAAIVALNVLLGWTFLGWVGALIWAMLEPKEATFTPN